jgi:hypothetical protein
MKGNFSESEQGFNLVSGIEAKTVAACAQFFVFLALKRG